MISVEYIEDEDYPARNEYLSSSNWEQDQSLLQTFYELYIADEENDEKIATLSANMENPSTLRIPAYSDLTSDDRGSRLLEQELGVTQEPFDRKKGSIWSCNSYCFDSNFPHRHLSQQLPPPFILPLTTSKVDEGRGSRDGETLLSSYYPHYYFDIHIAVDPVRKADYNMKIRHHNQTSLYDDECSGGLSFARWQMPSWTQIHTPSGWMQHAKLIHQYFTRGDSTFIGNEVLLLLLQVFGVLALTSFALIRILRRANPAPTPRSSSNDKGKRKQPVSIDEPDPYHPYEAYVKDQIAQKRDVLHQQQQLLLHKQLERAASASALKRLKEDSTIEENSEFEAEQSTEEEEKAPELYELYATSGKASPPLVNNPLFTEIYRQRGLSNAEDAITSPLDDAAHPRQLGEISIAPMSPSGSSTSSSSHLSSPRKVLSLQWIKRIEVQSPRMTRVKPQSVNSILEVSSSSSSSPSSFPELSGINIKPSEGEEGEDAEQGRSSRSSPIVDFTEIYPTSSKKEEVVQMISNPSRSLSASKDHLNNPNHNPTNLSGDGKTSREDSNDSNDSNDSEEETSSTPSVEYVYLEDVGEIHTMTERTETNEGEEEEERKHRHNHHLSQREVEDITEREEEEQVEQGEDKKEAYQKDPDNDNSDEEEEEEEELFASQSIDYNLDSITPRVRARSSASASSSNLVEEEVVSAASPSLFVWRYRAAQEEDVGALEVLSIANEDEVDHAKEEEQASNTNRDIGRDLESTVEVTNDDVSSSTPKKWRESRLKLQPLQGSPNSRHIGHDLLSSLPPLPFSSSPKKPAPPHSLPPLPLSPSPVKQIEKKSSQLPKHNLDHSPKKKSRNANASVSDDSSIVSQGSASSISTSSTANRSLKQVKEEFIRRVNSSASSRSSSPSTTSSSAAPLPLHSRSSDLPLISLENTIVRSFRTKYDLLKNVSLLQQRYNICFPRRYSPASLASPGSSRDSFSLREVDSSSIASSPNKPARRKGGLLSPPSPAVYVRHERDVYEKLHSPRRALRGVRSRSLSTSRNTTPGYHTPIKTSASPSQPIPLVTQSVDRFHYRVEQQRDEDGEMGENRQKRSLSLTKSYDDISVDEILDLRKGFDQDLYQRLVSTTAPPPVVPSASLSSSIDAADRAIVSSVASPGKIGSKYPGSPLPPIKSSSNLKTYSYDNKDDVAISSTGNTNSRAESSLDLHSDNENTVSYEELRQRQPRVSRRQVRPNWR